MILIKSIIKAKIRNQMCLLRALEKTRDNVNFSQEIDFLANSLIRLEACKGNLEVVRNDILGIEGFASSIYFSCLAKILPFRERQQEAKDPFNIMLNYGYGILYSEVEKACILAGLDPYLGFLHSDRYGKPSMVLDLIENFRQPVVDRSIITLFAHRQVKEGDVELNGNVAILSKVGKKKVVEAVLERLHTKVEYRGTRISFQGIILEQCRSVSRYIRGEVHMHKPFCCR